MREPSRSWDSYFGPDSIGNECRLDYRESAGCGQAPVGLIGRECREEVEVEEEKARWELLSNHGMVLVHLAASPSRTQRDLSYTLGITERQVGRIINELRAADMLRIERRGRRNSYIINPNARMRHPTLSHIPIRGLVEALAPALKRGAEEPAWSIRYRSDGGSESG